MRYARFQLTKRRRRMGQECLSAFSYSAEWFGALGEGTQVKLNALGEGAQWNYAHTEMTQSFMNFIKLFSECA